MKRPDVRLQIVHEDSIVSNSDSLPVMEAAETGESSCEVEYRHAKVFDTIASHVLDTPVPQEPTRCQQSSVSAFHRVHVSDVGKSCAARSRLIWGVVFSNCVAMQAQASHLTSVQCGHQHCSCSQTKLDC
jgi:hypothetical protein